VKKVIKLGMLLLVVAFALTGCISTETALKINEDGSFDVALTTIIDAAAYKELLAEYGMTEGITDEQIQEEIVGQIEEQAEMQKTDGFEIEIIENGLGFIAKKHYNNIDDLKEDSINDLQGVENFTIIDNEDGTREIKANINFTADDAEMGGMTENFEYKFKIELPYKAKNSNATETSNDKKTLTWNLDLTKNNEISITTVKLEKNDNGEYKEATNIPVVLIGGIIAGVAVVGIIVVLVSKKGKKTETSEESTKEVEGDGKTEE